MNCTYYNVQTGCVDLNFHFVRLNMIWQWAPDPLECVQSYAATLITLDQISRKTSTLPTICGSREMHSGAQCLA